MSSLITIGQTAQVRDIIQDRRGDFRWAMAFFDVSASGTEAAQDLTNCAFEFIVYAQDGITELLALTELGGITVSGNNVQVDIEGTSWGTWLNGCRYPYFFRKTDSAGFKTAIFKGNFILN